jgi:hypothetical protein
MSKDREPPAGVIVASNGAWRDSETGRFVPGGPVVDTAITKDNADSFRLIREQKKLEGLLVSNAKLAEVAGSPGDGWANVAGAMYDTARDKKSRVAAVQAARLLGEMTGFMSGAGNGSDPVPPGGARLELGAGVVEDIFKYIQEYRDTTD